eukprot:c27888_g1_i1.p1 GENE.c27888_g1_i1~~c27888_g1_i1.p1  ORF type:complete len:156 (-),score=68.40 c27888_g1_i1:79-546(-)
MTSLGRVSPKPQLISSLITPFNNQNNNNTQNNDDSTKLWTCKGLSFERIEVGDRINQPKRGQKVKIHYSTELLNGKIVDSSWERGKPFEFRIGRNEVVPGLEIAVLKMSLGEKVKLILTPEMAYGNRGIPPLIPPCSTLVFKISLLAFSGLQSDF